MSEFQRQTCSALSAHVSLSHLWMCMRSLASVCRFSFYTYSCRLCMYRLSSVNPYLIHTLNIVHSNLYSTTPRLRHYFIVCGWIRSNNCSLTVFNLVLFRIWCLMHTKSPATFSLFYQWIKKTLYAKRIVLIFFCFVFSGPHSHKVFKVSSNIHFKFSNSR